MKGRDFLSVLDLNRAELMSIFERTDELKSGGRQGGRPLSGKKVALIFMKPSSRTRVSFEVGVHELGGLPLVLFHHEIALGKREEPRDVARVFERMLDGIVARVFEHGILEELANYANIPVINSLSDYEHPCQALADLYTLREEFGDLEGRKLVFVGDGNNVARSLMFASVLAGMEFVQVGPAGYHLTADDRARAETLAEQNETVPRITVTSDLNPDVLKNADCIYTDVWASMGQEEERTSRLEIFRPYRITPELISFASPRVVFLHCLPAHRGEEVTDAVMEGKCSRVFPQAENRLHVQKAILWNIYSGEE